MPELTQVIAGSGFNQPNPEVGGPEFDSFVKTAGHEGGAYDPAKPERETIPEPAEHKAFRKTDKQLTDDFLAWRKGITGEDEAPEAKPADGKAQPQQKAEPQPESPEQQAARSVQELDQRLLSAVKPDDPAHEVFAGLVEANQQHAGHPVVQGTKALLLQAAGRYQGEELAAVAQNVLHIVRQPFDATREGYARHQTLGAAIANVPNGPDVLLFLSEPRNTSIVRAMWDSSPEAIGAAVHSISRDLLWANRTTKDEKPSAPPETRASRPPSEVGGRATAAPDPVESAGRNRDFRTFETAMSKRAVERRWVR